MATSGEGAPPLKKGRLVNFDPTVCLKCCSSEGTLVESPKLASYENFISCAVERAEYGDSNYFPVSRRLQGVTAEELQNIGCSWHRECYSTTVHKLNLIRLKARFQKAAKTGAMPDTKAGRPSTSTKPSTAMEQSNIRLTRSGSTPYDKNSCFFCEKEIEKEPLHQFSELKTGNKLRLAVEASDNPRWKVNLSAALNPDDALSIDIKYHLPCYVKYVQRSTKRPQEIQDSNPFKENEAILLADIEFYHLIQSLIDSGAILDMMEVQKCYNQLLLAHGVHKETVIARRKVKQKLQDNVHGIEFCRSTRITEPERICSSKVKDKAVAELPTTDDPSKDIQTIFECAKIIRRSISSSHKNSPWKFDGSLSGAHDVVPKCLLSMLMWIIQGPAKTLESETRATSVQSDALVIAQNIMYSFKSNRQVTYQPKGKEQVFRHQNENPQVTGLALVMHQRTRSKAEVELLHRLGHCIEYSRVLRIETQLANAILNKMKENGGIYIPATVVPRRFIFFATDNVDFSEDTCDGKRTLHGTMLAAFQQKHCDDSNETSNITLTFQPSVRSLGNIPSTFTELVPCSITGNPKPLNNTKYRSYQNQADQTTKNEYAIKDTAWLLARFHHRHQTDKPHCAETTDKCQPEQLPSWSAYNSLTMVETQRQTYVHTFPLISAPAHEWQTLLTVLMQAQKINTQVVGPDHKTVITLDMALYERAKKLEHLHPENKDKWILRIGELHTVLCTLRAIGATVEGSGIDDAWISSDMFGPLTVRQILEGRHMRRSLEAHITTLQVFFDLYMQEFIKENPDFENVFSQPLVELMNACTAGDRGKDEIANNNKEILRGFEEFDMPAKMNSFEDQKLPMFKVAKQYMEMVMALLLFIRATRQGLWTLHLAALDQLCKYFFMRDRLKYAQMVPQYLAQMYSLRESDPVVWTEFINGNFSVNKSDIDFCSIGVDHAIEHINRQMKVKGGLCGITQKPAALTRFFLVGPEMTRLAQEFEQNCNIPKYQRTKHHELSKSVTARQESNIEKLHHVIDESNPFASTEDHLMNFITKAIMPNTVAVDILNCVNIGEAEYRKFVSERIEGQKNLWDKMTKLKLQTWKDASKATKVKLPTKEIELKESRSLFARLLISARARPEIDLEEVIGNYEFSCVPRSLCSADGSLLQCSDKSKLLPLLEALPKTDVVSGDEAGGNIPVPETTADKGASKAIIIDAMAMVQERSAHTVKTCSEFADLFLQGLDLKCQNYDAVHVVFDRYDVGSSLKQKTREIRQGKLLCCAYEVSDKTQLKVPLRKFLSNVTNKDRLTSYLGSKTLSHFRNSEKAVVVATKDGAKSNILDVEHLNSDQEEADTLLILHAIDAARRVDEVHISSPDTDVVVLALQKLPVINSKVCVLLGTGQKRRNVLLQPIYNALGRQKADGLLGFHALTGSDTTGRIVGKGKATCWKAYTNANEHIWTAFSQLGKTEHLLEQTQDALEEFVCALYAPLGKFKDIGKLRWHLFKRKHAESEKLPPTKSALKHHLLRAHYQAMVWLNSDVAKPHLPAPWNYGWKEENGAAQPVLMDLPPAPDAVLELVKCGCRTSRCTMGSCSCKKHGLFCTELCACDADSENCENVSQDAENANDSSDEENLDEDTDLDI